MDEFLGILRENAVYVKIEDPKHGGGVDINSLVKALNAINKSYSSFIEASFKKSYNQPNKSIFRKELGKIKKDSTLLIVDLNFASFGAAIAPNIVTSAIQVNYLLSGVKDWKKDQFKEFKEEVIYSDYNSQSFLKHIQEKYDKEERASIFRPIINDIIKNQEIEFRFGEEKNPYKHRFPTIKSELVHEVLVPKEVIDEEVFKDKIYQVFITTSAASGVDLFGNKSIRYKEIHAVKELEEKTYPYYLDKISFEDRAILLNYQLESIVEYDKSEKLFHITYSELNLHVWGDSREEAEEAFNFAFFQLYDSIALEDDINLTPKAIILKNKILSLIKSVESNEK